MTPAPDHATLDVMNYNIEGLGWPAKPGRGAALREIGRRLAELRATGKAPDVILFQEVFNARDADVVRAIGYPYVVQGPRPWDRRSLPSDGRVPGRDWRRGEIGLKLAGGGLTIASRYPILAYGAQPFSHRSCAGLDCLSNKGALFARILVPGAPAPVDLFTTHLNARKASREPIARTAVSHRIEAQELADFIAKDSDPADPAIVAGDFNVRRSAARFATIEQVEAMTVVQKYCAQAPAACDAPASWRGPTPWLEAEDLQLFRSGAAVTIRPVRAEALFDGRPDSPQLSDHDAMRVVYRLEWPGAPTGASTPAAACRVARTGWRRSV